ncbi:hypothetical protein [Enterococcus durans]|uniref:Uncharacterized protein n=1 Tax=Enterococcus durans TaxID=53345 RepID=A0AB36S4K1_9ENTE|nr:hypothetical protein [Enterococcus durans]PEH43808.1 hypothetical protein CRM96_01690 [Enterococcus durans]
MNGQSKSTEELTLQETQDYVVITLKETQYQLERLDQYRLFLEKQKISWSGKSSPLQKKN